MSRGPVKSKSKIEAEFMNTIAEEFKPYIYATVTTIRGDEVAQELVERARIGMGFSKTTQKYIVLEAMQRGYRKRHNHRI